MLQPVQGRAAHVTTCYIGSFSTEEVSCYIVLYYKWPGRPGPSQDKMHAKQCGGDLARGSVQGMSSGLLLVCNRLPLHSCDRQGLWTIVKCVFSHPHSHEARVAFRTLCASNLPSNKMCHSNFPRDKTVAQAELPQSSSWSPRSSSSSSPAPPLP